MYSLLKPFSLLLQILFLFAISSLNIDEIDDVAIEFTIHKKRHSFLFGKDGFEFIKRVSASTHTRIYIPRDSETQESSVFHSVPGTLEGSFKSVFR